MTQRECLLAAAEYIETDGASLSDDDAAEIVAILKRLGESDYPTRLLRVVERHSETVTLALLMDLTRALDMRLSVTVEA